MWQFCSKRTLFSMIDKCTLNLSSLPSLQVQVDTWQRRLSTLGQLYGFQFCLFFFSISGGLSFVLAQPGSCIPRALVDSRSPNLVLTVEKKWLQIPGLSANDNTVTGPQQRFNAYQRVRLAVYKTRIPAQSLKQEFSPFFFPVVLLQMFPNFLSFSPSLLLFCRTDLGGQRKQFSASWTS